MEKFEKMFRDAYIIDVKSAYIVEDSEVSETNEEEILRCRFKNDKTMKYVTLMQMEDTSFAMCCSPDKEHWKLCFGAVIGPKIVFRVSDFLRMIADKLENLENHFYESEETK